MADLLNEWRVSEHLVRIILMRVSPGRELRVGRQIERLARGRLGRGGFRIYRLFGSFDLVFIQDGRGVAASEFVQFGTIPYITGTSEYTCYKWVRSHEGRKQRTFELKNLDQPLIALSFLKINPRLTQESGVIPELKFAKFLYRSGMAGAVQMLNTLGWVESVLAISGANLDGLLSRVADQLPNLIYHQHEYFAEKTLTVIGHTLDVCVRGRKRRVVPLSKSPTVKTCTTVDFSVACKPKAMGVVEVAAKKFLALKDEVGLRCGPSDLHFRIPLDEINTINELREKLDGFKRATAAHLVRTYTAFEYGGQHQPWRQNPSVERLSILVPLARREAELLASGGPSGEAVATAIYRFGNLTQTDVVVDAYSDLVSSVSVLRSKALRQAANAQSEPRGPLAVRLSFLESAINQRSQNVYLGLEESPFVAYPGGMGIQRIFKGLEAYATMVLRRFGKRWDGFACLGGLYSRFEHYVDILVVPSDAVMTSVNHWALSHELMHILENISPETLSLQNAMRFEAAEGTFKPADLSPSNEWWPVVLEAMTDVLDFALCCPLTLEEYLGVVWRHLQENVIEPHQVAMYETYLYRSFAVICFEHYVQDGKLNADMLSDLDGVKALLLNSIPMMERHAGIYKHKSDTIEGRPHFERIAQKFVNDPLFYMPWIFKRVISLRRSSPTNRPGSKALARICSKLQRGILLDPAELQWPDAVAWHLRLRHKNSASSHRTTMTWLLSLWHCYQTQRLGTDITKCVVQAS